MMWTDPERAPLAVSAALVCWNDSLKQSREENQDRVEISSPFRLFCKVVIWMIICMLFIVNEFNHQVHQLGTDHLKNICNIYICFQERPSQIQQKFLPHAIFISAPWKNMEPKVFRIAGKIEISFIGLDFPWSKFMSSLGTCPLDVNSGFKSHKSSVVNGFLKPSVWLYTLCSLLK